MTIDFHFLFWSLELLKVLFTPLVKTGSMKGVHLAFTPLVGLWST